MLLALAVLPTPARSATGAGAAGLQLPPPPDTVAALTVRSLERSPATAVAVAFPSGSGDDPEGAAGAASLLARSLEHRLRQRLPGAALVTGRVDRDLLAFVVVTPPDDAPGAWEILTSVLFGDPLPPEVVEEARQELLGPLRFERGAPVRAFEEELRRLVLGSGHPWARPVQGIEGEMAALPAGSVEELRRSRLRASEAHVAVVGPVDRAALRSWMSVRGEAPPPPPPDTLAVGTTAAGDSLPLPAADTLVAPDPPPPPAPPAWTSGERVVLERNVVNGWVAVAWPAPADLPRVHLEYVAHVARELLTPEPPDPGLFSVRATVEETPDGPALRIVAAVLPGETQRWEARILGVIPGLVDSPPPPDFLAVYRRRFAGETLLPLSLPEEEALVLAGDLVRGTHHEDRAAQIHDLGTEELLSAVRRLGSPRILLFGPPPGGG